LFAAVSSSPQEATLEDQRQWARETAIGHGWVITREFAGVGSGAKGTREILTNLIGARASEAEYQRNACSFAQLLEELPGLWTETTVELQQELARALEAVLAESPEFGGLFADPSCRGQLVFRPVAKQRKTEDEITKKWISLI
ncbi:MAG TPA: recombinase family protein, partial [Candidatus Baltobacteraceae bacterium]|nr:recombinase family protein [Candidatus Baltobacteraceae bacterium]